MIISRSNTLIATILSHVLLFSFALIYTLLTIAIDVDAQQATDLIVPKNSGFIECIALSDDGRFIAAGTRNAINIWQLSDRKLLRIIRTEIPVISISFSHNSKYLAAALADQWEGLIKRSFTSIWQVSDWTLLRTFSTESVSVAFNLDDSQLGIVGGKDISIWNVFNGKRVQFIDKIEPGLAGQCGNLSFSPDGKLLATPRRGDSNVGLWQVLNGVSLKTLGPRGRGSKLCTAFSPSGELLAMAELENMGEGPGIRIVRVSDGQLLRTLRDGEKGGRGGKFFGDTIAIAFSPNGEMIASGLNGKSIKIWSVSDGRLLTDIDLSFDSRCKDFDAERNSLPVAFTFDGRFIAYTDGINIKFLRIPNWKIAYTIGNENISSTHGLSFSPDSKYLASISGTANISLWNLLDGTLERTFRCRYDIKDNYDIDFGAFGLLFSSEGRFLVSLSSSWNDIEGKICPLNIWEIASGKLIKSFGHGDGRVTTLYPKRNGVFASYHHGKSEKGILKFWQIPDGRLVTTIRPEFTPGALNASESLWSSTGGEVSLWRTSDYKRTTKLKEFFGESSCGYVSFSPDGRLLASYTDNAECDAEKCGDIDLWDVSNGKIIRTFPGRGPFAFSPDGGLLATQGEEFCKVKIRRVSDGTSLQSIDACGKLAFSPDGGFFAIGGDTIKIYRLASSGSGALYKASVEIMTSQDGEYVVFTPDGYYNTTSEGSLLVNWSFSGGLGPEAFSFEQFESVYKQHDIVKSRLRGDFTSEGRSAALARPPFIEMSKHETSIATESKTFFLKLNILSSDEAKVLRVFVNGKPTLEVPVNAKEKALSLDVPLFPGANRITAVAYNDKGFSSNPKYVDVICKRTDLPKPNLYGLGIGVSQYPKLPQEWQLSYAHSDAGAVMEAFRKQEGKLFGEVHTKLLSNEEATGNSILEVLKSLEGLSENDIAVIFLAGHGVMAKDGTFYYLTSEGSLEEPEKGGLSWKVLGEHLEKVKGRVIMLLDACHSGNVSTETVVPNDELAQKLRSEGRSGVMVFSASKGRQSALESPDLGGGFGAFAYTLTQALGPKAKEADLNDNGFVEFMELVDYVTKSVDKETEGEQTPWLSRKELFGDLAIAAVPGGAPKPVAKTIPAPPTGEPASKPTEQPTQPMPPQPPQPAAPATSPASTAPGKTRQEPLTNMEFVWVPGGCYAMGCENNSSECDKDEHPSHEVCVDGLWMGSKEVTVGQFRRFVEATSYRTEAEKNGWSWVYYFSVRNWEKKPGHNWRNPGFPQDDRHPVVHVSWNDAQAMIRWLAEKTKSQYLLPTEAQWEWACRAGTRTARFWGSQPEDTCRYANVADRSAQERIPGIKAHGCTDGFPFTAPTGSFAANGYGLYDMLGNVWEWCLDVYNPTGYSQHQKNNPVYNGNGPGRAFRGASWSSEPKDIRCANRFYSGPEGAYYNLGFRLVATQ